MDKKLIARPTFNRKSEKWNIAIKEKNKEIKIGKKDNNGLTFNYTEFNSKKEATGYINNDERLVLYNPLIEVLNKYSRN